MARHVRMPPRGAVGFVAKCPHPTQNHFMVVNGTRKGARNQYHARWFGSLWLMNMGRVLAWALLQRAWSGNV
jgi:hypothetical protein